MKNFIKTAAACIAVSLATLTINAQAVTYDRVNVGKSFFDKDQGGAVELCGKYTSSTPYIDFSNKSSDWDARLILMDNQSFNIWSRKALIFESESTMYLKSKGLMYLYGGDIPAIGINTNGGVTAYKGLTVQPSSNYEWATNLTLNAVGDHGKSLVINNTAKNETVFMVWGSGAVNAKYIYTEGIQVRRDGMGMYWYDHVFHSDYDLMPLEEVESFINENSHLPSIPSQEDVDRDGVDLFEMEALLLKKVEEMTLYLIQQQKEIKSLKEQLNNQ